MAIWLAPSLVAMLLVAQGSEREQPATVPSLGLGTEGEQPLTAPSQGLSTPGGERPLSVPSR
jgi:hypothetical protein